MCTLFIPDEDRTVNINSDQLEIVVPERNDQVKVIYGEDKERIGYLLSIDNQEGVVKFSSPISEVRLLPLRYFCKYRGE